MRRTYLAIAFFLLTSYTSAQNTWTSLNGPWYANDPRDISAVHDTIYTIGGSNREVLRSVDHGVTWTHLGVTSAYCLAAKPDNASIVLVGFDDAGGKGVKRSSNAGSSWTTIFSSGLANRPNRITFSPVHTDYVYVGTTEASTGEHLARSNNAGGGFTNMTNFNVQTTVTDIVFDPVNDDTVFITGVKLTSTAGVDSGMWRTTTGISGSNPTWSVRSFGTGANKAIGAVVVSPSNHLTVYAGTYKNTLTFYKSTNAGGTWTNSQPTGAGNLGVRDMKVSGSTTLVATVNGIWYSNDGGVQYQALTTNGLFDKYCQSLVLSSAGGTDYVYCGSAGAFYRSTNTGVDWVEKDSGMIKANPSGVAISGNSIYAAGSIGNAIGGIAYRSTDLGGSWNVIVNNIDSVTGNNLEGVDIAISPTSSSVILLSCQVYGAGAPRILRSGTSGASWNYAYKPGSSGTAQQIAIDAANNMYVAGSLSATASVFKSTDGGYTWSSSGIVSGTVYTVAVDRATPSTVYAGGTFGVYKSTNSAVNWSSTSGLPSATVNALLVDSSSSRSVFAGLNANGGSASCLWKSTNGGSTWSNVSTSPLASTSSVKTLFLHPYNNSSGYLTGADGATPFLYKTSSIGSNVFSDQAGLPTVNKVAIDPSTAGAYKVFFGSSDGVYARTYQWDGNLTKTFTFDSLADIQIGDANSPLTGLTVPQGVTLSMKKGATVKFLNLSLLSIDGSLRAVGSSSNVISFKPLNITTDTLYFGISLNSGSTLDTLKYCDFYRGYTGVTVNSSSSWIENCSIRECLNTGLYVGPYPDNPKIIAKKNRITGTSVHGTYGIFTDYSNLGIDSSYVSGFTYGVYIGIGWPGFRADTVEYNGLGWNGTSKGVGVFMHDANPKFGGYMGNEGGYNVIRFNDSVEVQCASASPLFGNGTSGGYNKIYDGTDGRRIRATSSSTVAAQYTEWGGTGNPLPSFFYADGSSSIDTSNPIVVTPPTLSSPGNGDEIGCSGPTNITVSWNAVAGATSYRVQLARDIAFTNDLHDVSGVTGTQLAVNSLTCNATYYWHVNATDGAGTSNWSQRWSFMLCNPCAVTFHGVGDETSLVSPLPTVYRLGQNYPNPFNPTTTIAYDLPENSQVVLKLYDVLGREVKVLVDGLQSAGYKSVDVDASELPSGLYVYRLTAGSFVDIKKMMLVK